MDDLQPLSRFSSVEATPQSRKKDTVAIIEHFKPDAYGLLILAPEVALDCGWLGGDRVVGRAPIQDLLIKAARFNEEERHRLSIHLPGRAVTLRLGDVEQHLKA